MTSSVATALAVTVVVLAALLVFAGLSLVVRPRRKSTPRQRQTPNVVRLNELSARAGRKVAR